MDARSLNRSSANHQVYLGNESMEILLRNTYSCAAWSAKCIQLVAIHFLWEGSQPWKVKQKGRPLKELVTNNSHCAKGLWSHCAPGKTREELVSVQFKIPACWAHRNHWWDYHDVHSPRFYRQVFGNNTDEMVQTCVCLVTWECRAALPLQQWPRYQPKRDFGTGCVTVSLSHMAREPHRVPSEQHQAHQRLGCVWQELEFPPATLCFSNWVTENWSEVHAGQTGIGTMLMKSTSKGSKRTINEMVWHTFLTSLLSFCQIAKVQSRK